MSANELIFFRLRVLSFNPQGGERNRRKREREREKERKKENTLTQD